MSGLSLILASPSLLPQIWSGRCGSVKLQVLRGDITEQKADAIVNAANQELKGGGGVDGAIHANGGPAIMRELRAKYSHCPTGSAVITGAGRLAAKYVIHAVGPYWFGGLNKEEELLDSAYRSSLQLAVHNNCRSIAFPAISTGVYSYPLTEAAMVAAGAVATFAQQRSCLETIRFVLFNERAFDVFRLQAEQIASRSEKS